MESITDRQRLEWLGRVIHALLENPEAHRRVTGAFGRDDPKAFAKLLRAHWRKYGIEPPPDKCDPYVTSYVFAVLQPLRLVRRCCWVSAPPTLCWTPPPPPEEILQELIAKGFVTCQWVTEKPEGAEIQIVKKFVAGICPPGTY